MFNRANGEPFGENLVCVSRTQGKLRQPLDAQNVGLLATENGADILNLVEAFWHATQRQTMAYLGLQPEDVMKLYALNL